MLKMRMMKRIVNYTFLLLIVSTAFYSCDDFIEKDIEKETINLLTPGNNLTTVKLTHTFWWDWVEGAEQYNIQIVEGTFSSSINFVLDSIVTTNKFSHTLYPGSFQWRVRGLNNGYETMFSTYNLTIESTLDMSSLQVILSAPTDNIITNNNNVSFVWNSLSNADDYLVEVHQNTWTGNPIFGPQIENSTSVSTTLPEGVFEWGVQARNGTSNTSSAFFTRTITIDTTSPNAVILSMPADNSVLTDIFNIYSWTQGVNTGTALTNNIYFYSDASATILFKSAQATGTSYQDSLGVGTYYWAVRSTDAAGNIGDFSNLRKVTIQ